MEDIIKIVLENGVLGAVTVGSVVGYLREQKTKEELRREKNDKIFDLMAQIERLYEKRNEESIAYISRYQELSAKVLDTLGKVLFAYDRKDKGE